MRHLSQVLSRANHFREPIESLPRAYREPIESLSRAHRWCVESLPRARWEPIAGLSRACREPAEGQGVPPVAGDVRAGHQRALAAPGDARTGPAARGGGRARGRLRDGGLQAGGSAAHPPRLPMRRGDLRRSGLSHEGPALSPAHMRSPPRSCDHCDPTRLRPWSHVFLSRAHASHSRCIYSLRCRARLRCCAPASMQPANALATDFLLRNDGMGALKKQIN